MSDGGIEVDQRDLPPRWHAGALLGSALALGLLYALATWLFL